MKKMNILKQAALILIFSCMAQTGIHAQDVDIAAPPDPLSTFDLPSINIKTAGSESHIIKMTIVLGYENSTELKNELATRENEMLHIIRILLHSKKYKDLDSISDTIDLSEEIKARINTVLVSGKIKEIYFKEYIID